MGINIISING